MVMYRKFALPFVSIFIRLGISPNFITTLTLFAGILTFYLIIRALFIQAALLWQLILVLDVSDGMVARRTSKTSFFGLWYDFFTDRVNYLLLLIAMGVVIRELVFWRLIICAIVLFYLVDISSLIRRLQTRDMPYLDNRDKVISYTNKSLWMRSLKWLIRNFLLLHIHIFGFIGLLLFFSITGARFAICLITFILFVNLVYHIWWQITRVGVDARSNNLG